MTTSTTTRPHLYYQVVDMSHPARLDGYIFGTRRAALRTMRRINRAAGTGIKVALRKISPQRSV